MVTKNESYEKETIASHPGALKLAQRVSSSQLSVTSSESAISNDQQDYSAKYNEHELPENSRSNPSRALQAIVAGTPAVKPVDESTRGPTIRTTHLLNPETQMRKSESEDSDVIASGSDNISESEDENKSAIYNKQPQASSTGRYNVQQVTSSTPAGRDADLPPAYARDAVASGRDATAPPANARDAAASGRNATVPPANARDAVATGRDAAAPPANSRDAVATGRDAAAPSANARNAAASGTNPNSIFLFFICFSLTI